MRGWVFTLASLELAVICWPMLLSPSFLAQSRLIACLMDHRIPDVLLFLCSLLPDARYATSIAHDNLLLLEILRHLLLPLTAAGGPSQAVEALRQAHAGWRAAGGKREAGSQDRAATATERGEHPSGQAGRGVAHASVRSGAGLLGCHGTGIMTGGSGVRPEEASQAGRGEPAAGARSTMAGPVAQRSRHEGCQPLKQEREPSPLTASFKAQWVAELRRREKMRAKQLIVAGGGAGAAMGSVTGTTTGNTKHPWTHPRPRHARFSGLYTVKHAVGLSLTDHDDGNAASSS